MYSCLRIRKNIINKSKIWNLNLKLNFTFDLSIKTKIMVYKFRVILDAEEDVLEIRNTWRRYFRRFAQCYFQFLWIWRKWLLFILVMKLGTRRRDFTFWYWWCSRRAKKIMSDYQLSDILDNKILKSFMFMIY
jgi:hypothetical protein